VPYLWVSYLGTLATCEELEHVRLGGGVGGSTGDVIPDGGLSGSGHNMGINHGSIFVVSLGGATTRMMGGGTGPSGSSAVGTTSMFSTCAGSYKVAVSKLRVAKLSCVAAVCPTDSPVFQPFCG